jgi:hypothetical protein
MSGALRIPGLFNPLYRISVEKIMSKYFMLFKCAIIIPLLIGSTSIFAINNECLKANVKTLKVDVDNIKNENFCLESKLPQGIKTVLKKIAAHHLHLKRTLVKNGIDFNLPPIGLLIKGDPSGYLISHYRPLNENLPGMTSTEEEELEESLEEESEYGGILLGVFPNWGTKNFDIPEGVYVHELGHLLTNQAQVAFKKDYLKWALSSFSSSETFADWISYFFFKGEYLPSSQYPACAKIRNKDELITYNSAMTEFLNTRKNRVINECCANSSTDKNSDFYKYSCHESETSEFESDPTIFSEEAFFNYFERTDGHNFGMPVSSLLNEFETLTKQKASNLVSHALKKISENDLDSYTCYVDKQPSLKFPSISFLSLNVLWKYLSQGVRPKHAATWKNLTDKYAINKGLAIDSQINKESAIAWAWGYYLDIGGKNSKACFQGVYPNGNCEMICELK